MFSFTKRVVNPTTKYVETHSNNPLRKPLTKSVKTIPSSLGPRLWQDQIYHGQTQSYQVWQPTAKPSDFVCRRADNEHFNTEQYPCGTLYIVILLRMITVKTLIYIYIYIYRNKPSDPNQVWTTKENSAPSDRGESDGNVSNSETTDNFIL
jgi:hypothetical protein